MVFASIRFFCFWSCLFVLTFNAPFLLCVLFSKQMKCRSSCRVVETSCSRWAFTCNRLLFWLESWNDQKLCTWSWIAVRGKYPRLLKPSIFASRHSTSSMRRTQLRPLRGCFCRNLCMKSARNGTRNRVLWWAFWAISISKFNYMRTVSLWLLWPLLILLTIIYWYSRMNTLQLLATFCNYDLYRRDCAMYIFFVFLEHYIIPLVMHLMLWCWTFYFILIAVSRCRCYFPATSVLMQSYFLLRWRVGCLGNFQKG